MLYESQTGLTQRESQVNRFAGDMLVCLLFFFMIHGYQILKLGLYWDDMDDLNSPLNGLYVAQGRFVVALYRMVAGNIQMVPFAYGVSCAVYYALAVTLQLRILRITDTWARIMYMATCIALVPMINSTGLADAVLLGVFFVTLGYYFYQQWRESGKWLWGIFSLAAAVAGTCCYQVHVFLFGLLAVGDILRGNSDETPRQCMRRLVLPILLMGATTAAYILLKYISIRIMIRLDDDWVSHLSRVKYYQASLIGWQNAPVSANVQAICQTLGKLATGQLRGAWLFPLTTLPTLALVWRWRRQPMKIVLLGALWLLPLVPLFMLGLGASGQAFARLSFHNAVPMAIVWALWLENTEWLKRRAPDILPAILALSTVLAASYRVSASAFQTKRIYEYSVRKVQDVMMAVYHEQFPPEVNPASTPVMLVGGFHFHGGNTHKEGYATVFNDSRLFSINGMEQVGSCMEHDLPVKLREEVKQMPIFPLPGSIRYMEGKIWVHCPESATW